MALIDLTKGIPEILAETAGFDDLMETVQKTEEWDERKADVLDYIYRFRVDRSLRLGDEEDLRRLLKHLDRVTHPRYLNQLSRLDKLYAGRWKAYMDLLEDRLLALESPVPAQLLQKTHVREILNLVAEQAIDSQVKIRHHLSLRPANLTRILNLMEANELIVRKKDGREKRILLGPEGGKLIDPDSRPSTMPRHGDNLRERPAA